MARLATIFFILAGRCVSPAIASAVDGAPLVNAASAEHHLGKMVFAQLVTANLSATQRFYGDLLGWRFHDTTINDTVFSEVSMNGDLIAALIGRSQVQTPQSQPAWLAFLATDDLPALRNEAVQHGAKVLFEPHEVLSLGAEAVFVDPQGAVFATLASSSGDLPDELPETGEWIWSSLITNDPDTDAAFYQALFHYDVFELPGDAEAQHLILASDDYARASINPLPLRTPSVHPQWINYLRVDDTAATTAKVVELGGHVLVQPQLDRHGGRVAIVADPFGAVFGLMEWSQQAPSSGAK